MANPESMGLSYYPTNVNFQHDPKLRMLTRRYDFRAQILYQEMLSMAYADEGYYLAWSEAVRCELADFTRCTEDDVEDVLAECLRWSCLTWRCTCSTAF